MPGRISIRALLLACFFLSGASGLIYEILWMRRLTLIFGSTTFAVSTILTAFMAGLGLGSFLFGRIVDKWQRPLLTYGLLELLIGLYALLLPALFSALIPPYQEIWQLQPSFALLNLFRFLLTSAVLLIPTTLMGGTLPALSRFYVQKREAVGLNVGLLYGVNTLGAVVGAAAAGFFLLPEIGMHRTTWVAVGLNLAVGLFALGLAGREGEESSKRLETIPCEQGGSSSRTATPEVHAPLVLASLTAFGFSGFAAMVYEVAWTRLLILVLGPSTYAFTTMLVTFLVGLGLGGLLMAKMADRLPHPCLILALCQLGIGLSAFLGQHLFGALPALFFLLFRSFSDQPHLFLASQFLLAFLVMFVPTLLLGAVFPVVMRIAAGNVVRVGRLVGGAYAVNTVGTVLGAFAAGFLLVPFLGIRGTIGLAIGVNLLLGLLLVLLEERRGPLLVGALAVTAFALSGLFLFPGSWDPLIMTSGVYKEAPLFLRLYPSPKEVFSRITSQFKLLFYREGVSATVTVVERPSLEYAPHLTLAIDGKVDASTAADMSTQILSAHLPLLLHERPERVMVIGLASGMTVGSVLQHPIQKVTMVEFEPAVVDASRLFHAFNHRPLEDPRAQLIVDDGRNYLLATKERFDVIISEPSNPWMSGPSKLFTLEFFLLGKRHLKRGGIFAQWLQLYGMEPPHLKTLVRTLHSVFPHLLIFQTAEGDLILLGSERPLVIDSQRLAQQMSTQKVAEDLARVSIRDPFDLLVRFRLGSAEIESYVGSGPLNTDDNGLIEFAAPKSFYLETGAANLEEIRKASLGITGYLRNPGSEKEKEAFYLKLAKRHLSLGELQDAERLTLAGQPLAGTASGQWVLGEIHLKRGEEGRAVEAWREALEREPSHFEALMSLALFFQHRGRPREAEPYWENLLRHHPSNPLLLFYHGLNRYLLGDVAVAASKLTSALQEGLEHGEALDRYFRLTGLGEAPLARYYLSLAYGQLNRPALSSQYQKRFLKDLEAWREDLEQQPTDLSGVSPLLLFRFHLNRGIQIPEEVQLAELIHRSVGAFLIHYYKGTTFLFLGYPEEAVKELETALRFIGGQRESPLAHYYLGLAYQGIGQEQEATRHLEQALPLFLFRPKLRPRLAELYWRLAEIYASLGVHDRSKEMLRVEEEILNKMPRIP